MKKKKTPAIPDTYTSPLQTEATHQADVAGQNQQGQIDRANTTLDTTKQAVSPYLAGSSGMSEFRRALTGNLSHATATTGSNALARMRERAQASGFGANQPITFGAENQLANEQAGRIAAIPGQVEAQAAPLELQAANQLGDIGAQETGIARIYNPQGYLGQAQNMEDARLQEFYKQQEEARKKKAGIWGSLAKIGLGVGGSLIGGPVGGAIGGSI